MYKPPFDVVCIDCRTEKATQFWSHQNYKCVGRCTECWERMLREVSHPGFRFHVDGPYSIEDLVIDPKRPRWKQRTRTSKKFKPEELDEFYLTREEEFRWFR